VKDFGPLKTACPKAVALPQHGVQLLVTPFCDWLATMSLLK